jgi:hypothetical protein
MTTKSFKKLILNEIVTDQFIERIFKMTNDLYKLNINTDEDGKYKSTPKITNDQAKVIVAISFCLKNILPLCIHFSNINTNITNTNKNVSGKKAYIPCFQKIFMGVIRKFEAFTNQNIYLTICEFVEYRIEQYAKKDKGLWAQKKQLYGITPETYLQEIIDENIIVKSIYKLDYNKSVVSFIDAIVYHSYDVGFKKENYSSKPVELSAEDNSDSDDYLSKAESMEMSIYRVDESYILINNVNTKDVINKIKKKFRFNIPQEEFEFYKNNCEINDVNQWLLNNFYSQYFTSSTSTLWLDSDTTILLLIYLKKFLLLKKFDILPQLCTAKVLGKYKVNTIRNSRFKEKVNNLELYQVAKNKFKYVYELGTKDDPLLKPLSVMINSTFTIVDPDEEFNGVIVNEMNVATIDKLITEFFQYLNII